MNETFKNIIFWIVSGVTMLTVLFSVDLINLIISSVIVVIVLIIYYDCSFCPLEISNSNNKKDKYKNNLWLYLVLISLKFSLVLLFHVLNEYCDLSKVLFNFEKKYLSF